MASEATKNVKVLAEYIAHCEVATDLDIESEMCYLKQKVSCENFMKFNLFLYV